MILIHEMDLGEGVSLKLRGGISDVTGGGIYVVVATYSDGSQMHFSKCTTKDHYNGWYHEDIILDILEGVSV